jgi:DNA-binding LacI/PurR family transcriptional regulator
MTEQGANQQPHKPVTMQEIADRCGVNKNTVSLALRSDPRVAVATAHRILAVAEEMGYNPLYNDAARRLALRKSGKRIINQVVALFYEGNFTHHRYYAEIFDGLSEVCTLTDFQILLVPRSFDAQGKRLIREFKTLPPIFSRGDIDGAILIDDMRFSKVPHLLFREPSFRACPVMSLLWPAPGCSSVLTDDEQGGYLSVRHLLALGHRHILHCWGPESHLGHYLAKQRVLGYRRAYQEAGLDPEQYLHATVVEPYLSAYENVARRIQDACRQGVPFTAVLAQNDTGAGYARQALAELGLRVPQDVSLIGFDDTEPLLDDARQNMLTTVHLPLVDVGREGAKLLLGRIRGEIAEDTSITLPVELIVRGSTGPPAR